MSGNIYKKKKSCCDKARGNGQFLNMCKPIRRFEESLMGEQLVRFTQI